MGSPAGPAGRRPRTASPVKTRSASRAELLGPSGSARPAGAPPRAAAPSREQVALVQGEPECAAARCRRRSTVSGAGVTLNHLPSFSWAAAETRQQPDGGHRQPEASHLRPSSPQHALPSPEEGQQRLGIRPLRSRAAPGRRLARAASAPALDRSLCPLAEAAPAPLRSAVSTTRQSPPLRVPAASPDRRREARAPGGPRAGWR